MTTTIEAPRVAGRGRARADAAKVNMEPGDTVIVEFPSRASATPSYLDELVAAICAERRVKLVLRNLSERGAGVALESAARQGVTDLLNVE